MSASVPPPRLPFKPPVEPMLAQLTRELPSGADWLYEPKWDGFRAIVFWDGSALLIQSRDHRPLGRYFPEIEAGITTQVPPGSVLDGELVIASPKGLDFDALLLRIHPAASRISLLAQQTPASFVAFDLLAEAGVDLRARPQVERRSRLEQLLAHAERPLFLTPATADRALAERWFERFEGAGLDGVVAKRLDQPYQPGQRVMLKVKHQRTVDCVVVGFRWNRGLVGSSVGTLQLGLYDGGSLHHVGFTSSFKAADKRALVEFLKPYVDDSRRPTPEELREWGAGQSRWSHGKEPTEWQALRPELVCEVAFDHWQGALPWETPGPFGGRFRHGTTFLRWRPDKQPEECTFDQLSAVVPVELHEVFGTAPPSSG